MATWNERAIEAFNEATYAARRAKAAADSLPSSAGPRMQIVSWATVTTAWAAVGDLAVSLGCMPGIPDEVSDEVSDDSPVVVVDGVSAAQQVMKDILVEREQLAEHLDTAQRVIADLMSRMDLDSVVIQGERWHELSGVVFTSTVTGDDARVIRRVN